MANAAEIENQVFVCSDAPIGEEFEQLLVFSGRLGVAEAERSIEEEQGPAPGFHKRF